MYVEAIYKIADDQSVVEIFAEGHECIGNGKEEKKTYHSYYIRYH